MADSPLHPMQAFMPGLQFFQQMAQPAMQSMGAPSALSSWVTPTLDPDELDKKIQDLKTVQFWLEQNVKALAATIQTMEVQKLTLHTLRGMNVSLQEVAQSWQSAMPSMAAGADKPATAPDVSPFFAKTAALDEAPADKPVTPFAASTQAAAPAPAPASPPIPASAAPASASAADTDTEPAAHVTPAMPPLPPGMDPMQWWGTLSQQFQTIAQAAANTLAPEASAQADTSAAVATKSARKSAAKPAAKTNATATKKVIPKPAAKPAAKAAPRASTKPTRKP